MLERRPLGRSGIQVSEVGISVREGADADLLRRARSAGVDLFRLERAEMLPWLAEALGPAAVTVLAGTGAPPIGGAYVPGAPDAHLDLHAYAPLTEAQGALGPYRVLGGWPIGEAGKNGRPTRLDVARGVLADKSTQAVGLTYSLAEQAAGLGLTREASGAGAGVIAFDVERIPTGAFDFLVKPKRTLLQAATLFVLANQYVTAAVVRVTTRKQLAEVAGIPDAEGLSVGELERIIEMYIHRNDGGTCSGRH